MLYTLVVLARFFELSNKIFGFIGPLRGWQQGNLTFETPKESKRSIFRSCQPQKGPINPKIELDYPKNQAKRAKYVTGAFVQFLVIFNAFSTFIVPEFMSTFSKLFKTGFRSEIPLKLKKLGQFQSHVLF